METTLQLHDLPTAKRAGELSRLIDRLYRGGHRVIVWVADDGLRSVLDDYLWTFDQTSFVPHAVWTAADGEVDEPVVLVGEEGNPNGASELVVGDQYPPNDWARTFSVVHDVIPPGPEGDERREWWHQWRDEGDRT